MAECKLDCASQAPRSWSALKARKHRKGLDAMLECGTSSTDPKTGRARQKPRRAVAELLQSKLVGFFFKPGYLRGFKTVSSQR